MKEIKILLSHAPVMIDVLLDPQYEVDSKAAMERAIKALENYDALVETVKALVKAYQMRALTDQLPVVLVADGFIRNLEGKNYHGK